MIRHCLLPRCRLDAVCAPGYTGRKRGEVVRTRTTALHIHTRQWVGTYAGRGNGDYRGELASALQAITPYLAHVALSTRVALVRLDGQYGDVSVIAQILQSGVYLVTRGRGYHVCSNTKTRTHAIALLTYLNRPELSLSNSLTLT